MKKPNLLAALIIIALTSFSVYHTINSQYSKENIFYMNWNIEITLEFKEIYRVQSSQSIHGDGLKYSVYDAEPVSFPFHRIFSSGRNASAEELANEVTQALEIPIERRPNFVYTYTWLERSRRDYSRLVMFYFPDTNRYFVVEFLM